MIDYADLRRLAEQAIKPAPTRWWDEQSLAQIQGISPDAAYIAAANPQAILALLDERDQLAQSLETSHAARIDESHLPRDIQERLIAAKDGMLLLKCPECGTMFDAPAALPAGKNPIGTSFVVPVSEATDER